MALEVMHMSRFLASVLAALLMTATLTVPAEAGGKAGTIQSITSTLVTGSPFTSGCVYSITVEYSTVRKTGFTIDVDWVRTSLPGGNPSDLWTSETIAILPTSESTQKTFQTSAVAMPISSTYGYYVRVATAKWNHAQTVLDRIDYETTNGFTQMLTGSTCPATLGTYTR